MKKMKKILLSSLVILMMMSSMSSVVQSKSITISSTIGGTIGLEGPNGARFYSGRRDILVISVTSSTPPNVWRGFVEFNLQKWYDLGIDASNITGIQLELTSSTRQGVYYWQLYSMASRFEDGTISYDQLHWCCQFETLLYDNLIGTAIDSFDVTSGVISDIEASQQYTGLALKFLDESIKHSYEAWAGGSNPKLTVYYDDPIPPADSDNDGVPDDLDLCPNTPEGTNVDAEGCPVSIPDTDNDGINDDLDLCPNTPKETIVDDKGCPVDCLAQADVDQAVADAVYDKDNIIVDLKLTIVDLETALAQKDQAINDLNLTIDSLKASLSEKDTVITGLNTTIADLNSQLTAKDQTIAELNVTIDSINSTLAEKDLVIANLNSQIGTLNTNISQKDQQIADLNSQLTGKDQTIADLNAQISTMYTQEQLDQAVAEAQASALAGITSGMDIPGDIPGATPAEQLQNLMNAIHASPACENNIEKYFKKM